MSETDQPTPDERAGMAWWNELSEAARLYCKRPVCTVGELGSARVM
jgi:hypothetical protein